MKKYTITVEVPDNYEPLLGDKGVTALFFDTETGEECSVDGTMVRENTNE